MLELLYYMVIGLVGVLIGSLLLVFFVGFYDYLKDKLSYNSLVDIVQGIVALGTTLLLLTILGVSIAQKIGIML
tara:strand:+ start:72 stop:293 length:222 start_codon:yes stop_codon:yes gene_type:complete